MDWHVKLIPNFILAEMRCHGAENHVWHDCGLVIVVPELLKALEPTRAEFGKPLRVKSWTRCRAHNLAVGGTVDSYHLNGHAVDVSPLDLSDVDELFGIASRHFPFVSRYSWGLHGDVRGERPVMP